MKNYCKFFFSVITVRAQNLFDNVYVYKKKNPVSYSAELTVAQLVKNDFSSSNTLRCHFAFSDNNPIEILCMYVNLSDSIGLSTAIALSMF